MQTNKQYIFGGYYLIKRSSVELNKRGISQKTLFSLDENICSIYPSEWAMSGYQCPIEYKRRIMDELKLNKTQLFELQKWVDLLFKEQRFGISNVFSDINSAREFNKRYLQGFEDIKLIGIGLEEKYISRFFAENECSNEFYEGVSSNLSRKIPINNDDKSLGFEILGYLSGGFYSIWTVVNVDNLSKLNLQTNEFGLISNLDTAEIAATRLNNESMSSEPVYWMPWKLYEYNLE